MRRVHIVVEGRKDVYFLHELILQRFPALFSRANNVISAHAKKHWQNPCPMTGAAGALQVCWQNSEHCVAHHRFNAVTRKSRMNEFTAAFDSLAWEDNGINRCFARPNLWDWPSPAFDDIVAFLDGLFIGVTPTSFNGCL